MIMYPLRDKNGKLINRIFKCSSRGVYDILPESTEDRLNREADERRQREKDEREGQKRRGPVADGGGTPA